MSDQWKRLGGANMDIDLTSAGFVGWAQDNCPWNMREGDFSHRCAVKNESICPYFRGIAPLDTVLCAFGFEQEEGA